MSKRPSPVALVAILVLVGFTAWITVQAKVLEKDLDTSSQKITLLEKPAPDFHLTSLEGRSVSLADYRGKKKLVLVFWASWNNASHPQMLLLSVLYNNNHRPDSDFELVGISLDDDQAAAHKFVEDSKILFPVIWDRDRKISDLYKIRSVPTVLLVETDGKVSFGSVGFNRQSQGEFAKRLGLRSNDFRMEMGAPNGGRGN